MFNSGDTVEILTGGYTELTYSSGGTESFYSSVGKTIYLEVMNASQHSAKIGRSTNNAIDLTNVQTIYAMGNNQYANKDHNHYGIMVVSTKSITDSASANISRTSTGDFIISLDVSTLKGKFYIIPWADSYYSAATKVNFTQIWYE